MVVYQCETCLTEFTGKSQYEKHLNKKNPCSVLITAQKKKSIIFKCKCGAEFTRKDNLKRHLTSCADKPNKINNTNSINNGIQSFGNNNNITVQYNLFPFGKDGITSLTVPEKIAIFSSDENPMEMIIVKVNLDPHKLNHHNVGYVDNHCAYGWIFDGTNWMTESIDTILQVLFESKEKDLLQIHGEIKDFLSADANYSIKNRLDALNKKVYAGNNIDVSSRKKLIKHLKKHLYNNRNLMLEAKKHVESENKNTNHQNEFKNILKEGVTIDIFEKLI